MASIRAAVCFASVRALFEVAIVAVLVVVAVEVALLGALAGVAAAAVTVLTQ